MPALSKEPTRLVIHGYSMQEKLLREHMLLPWNNIQIDHSVESFYSLALRNFFAGLMLSLAKHWILDQANLTVEITWSLCCYKSILKIVCLKLSELITEKFKQELKLLKP